MKSHSRRAAAVLLAVVVTFAAAPDVFAGPRRDRELPNPIVRIIKKFQKIFGISTQDDQPLPPRPDPGT